MADGHRTVVYYQTQYEPTPLSGLSPNSPYGNYISPLPLIHLITHLFLAAFHINANKPVTIALNDFEPDHPRYDQMWTDIASMQSQGIKVIGMLGGAAPGTYECLTPDNFETFYPKLAFYIKKYKLDGMDLDVEQSVPFDDIVHLINRLKSDFGNDFIITLAPVASALEGGSNLSGFDYMQLEHTMGHMISWYNAQFFSGFGSIDPPQQYIDIVEYQNGLSPSRLVAVTLTNPDNGGGYVEIEKVVESLKTLTAKYGSEFGGVAGWEYFNSLPDRQKPWKWAEVMKSAMGAATQSNEEKVGPNGRRSRIWGRRALEAASSH
ncbi:endo-beta-N-acetylglucosaminidase [Collybia nuda]|uniref:chitinase n=1 Tax=Collybia nuda TaxID=64659 RepID=A0A9P5XZT7_9AGAR|nr:endo-beta-N-acetylglucosaminidase [Collybia nuda]